MCAIEAGKRGRRVTVIEHNDRVGKRSPSPGRPVQFHQPECGAGELSLAAAGLLQIRAGRYTPWTSPRSSRKHKIRYHEKKLGQQFCDTSSREIINLLLTSASRRAWRFG